MEDGKPSFHDSGSSLNHQQNGDEILNDDAAAAKCWDIAAADIVLCKRPDGSDWLLSTSESGQVQHTDVMAGSLSHYAPCMQLGCSLLCTIVMSHVACNRYAWQ